MAKTIAVVDDSAVMRSILRKTIKMAGIEVARFLEAEDGRKGFNLIVEHQKELDLIFTDLHMPNLGGLKMLQLLNDIGWESCPIVVCSTVSDPKLKEKCRALGVVAFLEKPFRHDEICEILEGLFEDLRTQ